MKKIIVMGAGSWGTALANVVAEKGHDVTLWEYCEEKALKLEKERENKDFLPGTIFPENLHVTNKLDGILDGADYIVFSVPAQVLRSVIKLVSNQITENMILINTAKGIEVNSGKRLSEVMKDEILGKFHPNIVVLSGPTHAEEVGKKLPTTIVAAGDISKSEMVQKLFNTNRFRVYKGNDVIGVELGGAVKNCLAIAAGIADGVGYGDNTKAALITRGLAEIIRFGEKFGASFKTFSGLTGMGDLIVTCASKHSRNRHVGEELGRGKKLKQILDEMHMVAEGVETVKAVYKISQEQNISMPIIEGVYKMLYEDKDVAEILENLMQRELKEEFYN